MSKKDIAVAFLRLAGTSNAREGYAKYVHPGFIHHNPYFKGDRESLLAAMEENAAQFPDKAFAVLRAIEDGDFVAVQAKVKISPETPDIALIHIFRFEGDLIVEGWEASQEELKDSPNPYGLF